MGLSNSELSKLVDFCTATLPLKSATLGKEFYYASLPLCVIDSVFSIGVRYEGVINTVTRFSNKFGIKMYRDGLQLPDEQDQLSIQNWVTI
jgi:hypothetical protein